MGSHPTRNWDPDKLRGWYMSGMTWEEIASKLRAPSWHSPYIYLRRHTPPESWPLRRPAPIAHRVKSNATRKQHRSVDGRFIMEMVTEVCEQRGVTLAQFAMQELGWSHTRLSRVYAWRTGRQRMSGASAATILRAIGEPVRKDLVA